LWLRLTLTARRVARTIADVTNVSAILERIRQLKGEFGAAHAEGMRALATHDHEALRRSMESETRMVAEHIALVRLMQDASGKHG
jgi:hypothetical protein